MAAGARDRLVRLLFPRRRVAPLAGPPRRILIIRPDHLGDLLFATPALVHLRAAYPTAHLTGLVGPWGRPVWERQATLDAIETLPFPGIVARPSWPGEPYTLLWRAARKVRAGHYDLALILRFDYWWGALLAEQAGIPARWGYSLPAMQPFLTSAVPYQAGRHEVEQNLALVAALTGTAGIPPPVVDRGAGLPPLQFPVTDAEESWAAQYLGDAAERTVAIHPGTNGSLKLWTLGGWAAVTAWLLAHDYRVVFTGAAAEGPLIDGIRAHLDPAERDAPASLAGQTTLGQVAALFARSRLVLGVDSGPLHIATAVGAPTVRLYGPSDEALWGPWGPAARIRIVRAPGTRPGHFLDPDRHDLEGGAEMQAITARAVIAAVEALLMRDA
ncbi:MAG TPA: glycosyltransferase family 9 protein [Chloroflexia bacterium]|nr:glycosyltransferase family 9 protein [Chloroflexia bacterium]